MTERGTETEAKTVDRTAAWILHIGTVHGDMSIRMFNDRTIQEDLIGWLQEKGLLSELQDKGNTDDR